MLTFRRDCQNAAHGRDIVILACVVRVRLDTLVIGIGKNVRDVVNAADKLGYAISGQRIWHNKIAFVSPELELLFV